MSHKTLYLRMWSNTGRIGFSYVPFVTNERRLTYLLFNQELIKLSICVIALCIAIGILFFPTFSKEYFSLFPLSAFLISCALYLLTRLHISAYLFRDERLRPVLEWCSLYLTPYFLAFFFGRILESKILHRFSCLGFSAGIFSILAIVNRWVENPWHILSYHHFLIVTGILLTIFVAIGKLKQGSKTARVLLIGLSAIFIVTIIDILHNQGLIPTSGGFLSYGFLIFILCLFWVAREQVQSKNFELYKSQQVILATHLRIQHLLETSQKMSLAESMEEAIGLALDLVYRELKPKNIGHEVKVTLFPWAQESHDQNNTFTVKEPRIEMLFKWDIHQSKVTLLDKKIHSNDLTVLESSSLPGVVMNDRCLQLNLNWGKTALACISFAGVKKFHPENRRVS